MVCSSQKSGLICSYSTRINQPTGSGYIVFTQRHTYVIVQRSMRTAVSRNTFVLQSLPATNSALCFWSTAQTCSSSSFPLIVYCASVWRFSSSCLSFCFLSQWMKSVEQTYVAEALAVQKEVPTLNYNPILKNKSHPLECIPCPSICHRSNPLSEK